MSSQTIRAILTDIEGTTSSISFVKDVLFPFARARLGDFVAAHGDEPEVQSALTEARALASEPDLDQPATIALLTRWIEEDKKAGPLKALQGMIWEDGYRSGALKGDIYPDAAENLAAWKAAGLPLYVYSSGSVLAQKLIFGHTTRGDMTGLFSGFFDTAVGSKLDHASYAAIAAVIGISPLEILFLSDNTRELDAAAEIGMKTIALDRGEVVIPVGQPHPVAKSFDDIDALHGLLKSAV
ncbi:acireductone synthase [Kaistia dalseonensis]|uniref:Enolase-phosphatase E1 n=1 Tax=Kaistia dalseonensis TaxID=410840 RepID=A0ABU0H5R2_9HYPH|nr:acireductone synthase [Kaistia dalseonensis]MCX5495059.1 acireductone synthase [Kaistia dalseonensis]MDQ0437641.1 enolase-phosphatase E1 [Kaistia dalseonensis]